MKDGLWWGWKISQPAYHYSSIDSCRRLARCTLSVLYVCCYCWFLTFHFVLHLQEKSKNNPVPPSIPISPSPGQEVVLFFILNTHFLFHTFSFRFGCTLVFLLTSVAPYVFFCIYLTAFVFFFHHIIFYSFSFCYAAGCRVLAEGVSTKRNVTAATNFFLLYLVIIFTIDPLIISFINVRKLREKSITTSQSPKCLKDLQLTRITQTQTANTLTGEARSKDCLAFLLDGSLKRVPVFRLFVVFLKNGIVFVTGCYRECNHFLNKNNTYCLQRNYTYCNFTFSINREDAALQ